MNHFFFQRIFFSFLTLLALGTLCFILMKSVPGSPFDSENSIPPEIKQNLEEKYGLNASLSTQYFSYLKNLMRGDLGPSFKQAGRSVNEIISEGLPVSMELGVYSLLLAIGVGFFFGIFSAVKHDSWIDYLAQFLTTIGISAPNYLVAAFLIYLFSLRLHWLPPALWNDAASMVLPIITLSMRPAAQVAQILRASMLENLNSDYVRAARARGLSEKKIVFKHVLKNSLVPLFALLAPTSAYILTGSFVVEYIFAIPGLGKGLISAVLSRDYSMIMGLTMLYGIFLLGINFIVDVLYQYLDPRMRLKS